MTDTTIGSTGLFTTLAFLLCALEYKLGEALQQDSMRIATYNVNGINGRLANLVAWLARPRRTSPVSRS